jgi:hypothetical protein
VAIQSTQSTLKQNRARRNWSRWDGEHSRLYHAQNDGPATQK